MCSKDLDSKDPMSIPLSKKTIEAASLLFMEPELSIIKRRLLNEVSGNIPFCENETPAGMERIRFAVLKLVAQDKVDSDIVFSCAKIDSRDLFLLAGFADSTTEHESWFLHIKRSPKDLNNGSPGCSETESGDEG
jgi:hypothetical protein